MPKLPNSPETQQLRHAHAHYREAISREFMLRMKRYYENANEENTKALGDFLFFKEHRARLMFILDSATDPERAAYGKIFADWARLQGFSPSEVAEHVDAGAIERLTHTATSPTSDTSQTRAKSLADALLWWRTEIVVPSDIPDADKVSTIYRFEDLRPLVEESPTALMTNHLELLSNPYSSGGARRSACFKCFTILHACLVIMRYWLLRWRSCYGHSLNSIMEPTLQRKSLTVSQKHRQKTHRARRRTRVQIAKSG